MRKMFVLTACIFSLSMMLSGCREILDMQVGLTKVEQDGTKEEDVPGRYEMTNYDYDVSEEGAVEIDLANLPENISDFGSYDGRTLMIRKAGTYLLSGKLNQGKIVVSVCEDEVVHLILNGVEIRSADGAAVCVEKADKVIITLKDGTESTLSDGPGYDDERKACIFSNSDLTINGSGFLAVYGYHADAVRSKDRLKLVNTRIYVKSKKDGLRGNDGVIIHDSEVEAECEGIGIFSDSDADMVVIQGGSCKVIAGENAVRASRYVSISDCQTDLYAVWEIVQCGGILEWEGVPEQ